MEVDRAVDRTLVVHVCAHRSTARELLLSVNGPSRLGGLLLGHNPVFGRLTRQPLLPTVGNPIVGGRLGGRPTAEFSAELDPNNYIF